MVQSGGFFLFLCFSFSQEISARYNMKNNLKRGTNDWNQDAQMAGLLATQIFCLHDELLDAKLQTVRGKRCCPTPRSLLVERRIRNEFADAAFQHICFDCNRPTITRCTSHGEDIPSLTCLSCVFSSASLLRSPPSSSRRLLLHLRRRLRRIPRRLRRRQGGLPL